MSRKAAVMAFAIVLIAARASAREATRVSIFLNPFKWAIGLGNVGFELQYTANCSVCISAEYACIRTSSLNRIRHPDLVATVGLRYYASAGDPDAAGSLAGISFSYLHMKARENRRGSNDASVGIEAGYKLPMHKSFYILPRGLLNHTFRGKKLLPGAEALGGMVL